MPLHEHWREYSEAEINKIKLSNCVKHRCPYLSMIWNNYSKNDVVRNKTCNYIIWAGKPRDQLPEECTHWKDKNVKKTPFNNEQIILKGDDYYG